MVWQIADYMQTKPFFARVHIWTSVLSINISHAKVTVLPLATDYTFYCHFHHKNGTKVWLIHLIHIMVYLSHAMGLLYENLITFRYNGHILYSGFVLKMKHSYWFGVKNRFTFVVNVINQPKAHWNLCTVAAAAWRKAILTASSSCSIRQL